MNNFSEGAFWATYTNCDTDTNYHVDTNCDTDMSYHADTNYHTDMSCYTDKERNRISLPGAIWRRF